MKKKNYLIYILLLAIFLLIPFLTNNYKAETTQERVSEKWKRYQKNKNGSDCCK